MAEKEPGGGGGESTLTVLVALGANAVIAVAKGIAALITGSAAMAAETAHSIADTLNEVLLLTALRRSTRAADPDHPFGYGQQRYLWSFIAAGSIFVTGALYSAYEGVEALIGEPRELVSPLVSYIVLGVSFVLEGISWVRSLQQVTREAKAEQRSLRAFLRHNDDPTATTVVFEDTAALIGLVLAALGVYLHQVTGSGVWDAVASLLIAVLLAGVAVRLGRTNSRLLTGTQADRRMVRAIAAWLGQREEVDAVVDLLTLQLGTDQVLVCARLDFDDALGAAEVERATVKIGADLREAFPDVAEAFLEPVPRDDEGVRERVEQRYGADIAARLAGASTGAAPRLAPRA